MDSQSLDIFSKKIEIKGTNTFFRSIRAKHKYNQRTNKLNFTNGYKSCV